MIYVRKSRHTPWHFALNCYRLPHTWDKIVESDERPRSGELCNECLAKEKRGAAQPIKGA